MAESIKQLSREEYLKRYLNVKEKKKRKVSKAKLPTKKHSGLRIVDNDDILKNVLQTVSNRIDDDSPDETPTIAEIIDERPQSVRTLEQYDSSRWKKVTRDSDEDIKSNSSSTVIPDRYSPMNSDTRTVNIRHDSDSDCSPVRRTCNDNEESSQYAANENSGTRVRQRHDSDDCDLSPPRRTNSPTLVNVNVQEKRSLNTRDSDSDLSPPRRNNITDDRNSTHSEHHHADKHKSRERRDSNSTTRSSSKSHGHKSAVTLSGLKAGLQYAATLHKEAKNLKKREKEHISMMAEDISGENAKTVHRNRDTGKVVDLAEEKRKVSEAAKLLAKKNEKYAVWGKGIEQQNAQKERLETDTYEMTKPLARYKDDDDLDKALREKEREGDPMLAYMKKKKQKTQEDPGLPKYNGPAAPPNRFNIEPGYRWDGVDRSNGFEKKYFEKLNTSKSKEIENHLWSVQDM